MKIFFLFGLAFLLGSIPFGFLIAKGKGVDIRKQGSGNIGATNVGRVLGKQWGILVFVLDVIKGSGAVLLSRMPVFWNAGQIEWKEIGCGLAVVLGHNFCPWLGGKGGKGIATTLGVLIVVFPHASAWALGAWIVFVLLTRYVSVGSLAAACALIISGFFYYRTSMKVWACLMLGLLAIFRHRSNIARLMQGTETKVFSSKKESS